MDKILGGIIQWVFVSSKDPEKVSLTVKGLLVGGAGYVLLASGFLGLPNLTPESWQGLTEDSSSFVSQALMVVGAVVAAFGAGRKLWNTGKNVLSKK